MKTERVRVTYVFTCDGCSAFKNRSVNQLPIGWEEVTPAYGLAPYGRHRCANCIRESKGYKRRDYLRETAKRGRV